MEPGDLALDYAYKPYTKEPDVVLVLGLAKIGKQEMLCRTLQPDGTIVVVPVGLLRLVASV